LLGLEEKNNKKDNLMGNCAHDFKTVSLGCSVRNKNLVKKYLAFWKQYSQFIMEE
jgi:hypothetical protein